METRRGSCSSLTVAKQNGGSPSSSSPLSRSSPLSEASHSVLASDGDATAASWTWLAATRRDTKGELQASDDEARLSLSSHGGSAWTALSFLLPSLLTVSPLLSFPFLSFFLFPSSLCVCCEEEGVRGVRVCAVVRGE